MKVCDMIFGLQLRDKIAGQANGEPFGNDYSHFVQYVKYLVFNW